jgi:hypothetical protein
MKNIEKDLVLSLRAGHNGAMKTLPPKSHSRHTHVSWRVLRWSRYVVNGDGAATIKITATDAGNLTAATSFTLQNLRGQKS